MAAAVRYIRPRGSVYQYERRVPTQITRHAEAWEAHFSSQRLWRRSLRTSVASEMFAAAEAAHNEFQRRRAAALEQMGLAGTASQGATVVSPRLKRQVVQFDLDMLEADRRRMEVKYFEQLYLRANGDVSGAELLADQIEQFELDAADRRHAIVTPGFQDDTRPWLPSPMRDAREMVSTLDLDAPEGSPAFGAVVAAIRRGYLAGAHDVDELLAGRAKARAVVASPAAAPKLSEAVKAYIAHKALATRTVRQIETCRDELIALVGDKPLDALTRADFESYVELRANRVVGGKSEEAIERPAAAQTVKKALGLLRSAIGHAIDHKGFAFDGPNPASGIKVETYIKKPNKAVMPDKRPFRVGDMNKLLQHPWFTGCESASSTHRPGDHRLAGAEYWAPIVAIYTGARVSELGGLSLAEILIDDPHPHFFIRDNHARGTKKGYARCVPMLDALFEVGFREYVEQVKRSGAERLFPDWTPPASALSDERGWYNSKLVKAFNRTVVPKQLGDTMVAGARRDVTFHSFRGAFKSMLGSARFGLHPNIINEVVGHAKSGLDQRYIGVIPIEETYPAIRACRYQGLVIPPAPLPR